MRRILWTALALIPALGMCAHGQTVGSPGRSAAPAALANTTRPTPESRPSVIITGWKGHSDKVQVISTGGLVFPRHDAPGPLQLVPALSQAPVDDEPATGMPRTLPPWSELRLLQGSMPGVEATWELDGLEFRQVTFCTLLEASRLRTGREDLVAHVRYTLRSTTPGQQVVSLWVHFGAPADESSGEGLLQPYPRVLSWDGQAMREPDGRIAARLDARGSDIRFHRLVWSDPPATRPAGAESLRHNSLRIDMRLRQGESRSVELSVPYRPLLVERLDSFRRIVFDEQFAVFRASGEAESPPR